MDRVRRSDGGLKSPFCFTRIVRVLQNSVFQGTLGRVSYEYLSQSAYFWIFFYLVLRVEFSKVRGEIFEFLFAVDANGSLFLL